MQWWYGLAGNFKLPTWSHMIPNNFYKFDESDLPIAGFIHGLARQGSWVGPLTKGIQGQFRLRSPQVLCDAIRVGCSSGACPEKHGLPDALSRRTVKRERSLALPKETPLGPLCGEVEVEMLKGPNKKYPMINPMALLWFLCTECVGFRDAFRQQVAKHQPSLDTPHSVCIYQDEILPGNPLRVTNERKLQCWYWSIAELGYFCSDEDFWLHILTVRSSEVKKMKSGTGTVVQTSGREVLCCPILCAAWSDVATGWWAKGHVVWTNVCDSGRWGCIKELPQLQRSSWGNALPTMPQRMPVVKWSTHPWPIRGFSSRIRNATQIFLFFIQRTPSERPWTIWEHNTVSWTSLSSSPWRKAWRCCINQRAQCMMTHSILASYMVLWAVCSLTGCIVIASLVPWTMK